MTGQFPQMKELQLHGMFLHDLNPTYTESEITQMFQRFSKTFFDSVLDGHQITESYPYTNYNRNNRIDKLFSRLVWLECGE